jgi:hypothetical protein
MKIMKCGKDLTTNLKEKKIMKKIIQINKPTVQASSSEPAIPFHKIITIVNINDSQSSSSRPPSSILVDEGTTNDVSSVLVTPGIR